MKINKKELVTVLSAIKDHCESSNCYSCPIQMFCIEQIQDNGTIPGKWNLRDLKDELKEEDYED